MSEISGERRLFLEAVDLAIRLQNDPGNPVSARMVRAWMGRSDAHEAAWAKVAAIHGMTGLILMDRAVRRPKRKVSMSRRHFMLAGAAGISAIAAGSSFVPGIALEARADLKTNVAELKQVNLSDGSFLTLGPSSAVRLDFADKRRHVDLLYGMAYFAVKADMDQPLSVQSGPVTLETPEATFDISDDAGFVSVSVDRGTLKSQTRTVNSDHGETLAAGEWFVYDLSTGDLDRGVRDTSQIAAWRNGLIVAERETVSALISRISRWKRGKVIIADPDLGSRRVSGVFDLKDPEQAIAAVIRPFGAKARQLTRYVTIITPV